MTEHIYFKCKFKHFNQYKLTLTSNRQNLMKFIAFNTAENTMFK